MIDFDRLKAEALTSARKRSRVILEAGFDMVICLHRDSYVRMHRHPRYEAYHVIEGTLSVVLHFDDEDVCSHYDKHDPFVRLLPMRWHQPSAVTEFVIYREFYCGPFEKARDVEYHPLALPEAA